jgi:hypothetical protein
LGGLGGVPEKFLDCGEGAGYEYPPGLDRK